MARFFVSFAISAALCAKRTVQQLWRPALFQGRRRPPALPPAGILPSPVRRARPFFHNPVMPGGPGAAADRPPPAKRQPVQARFPVLASVGGHWARRGQKAATGTALRPCPLHLSLCPDRVRRKAKRSFLGSKANAFRAYSTMLSPVISAGWGSPISLSMVGAISARRPPSRRVTSPAPATRNGTGLVVCAVKGVPSSSAI